jgi:hypothetical protein
MTGMTEYGTNRQVLDTVCRVNELASQRPFDLLR